MKNGLTIPGALGAALILAGCGGEQATEPELRTGPLFAKGGAAACPTAADFVVTDEAELRAALAVAVSGQVIGLDGMIDIAAEVLIETPGITLTCATAGSGVHSSAGEDFLISAVADDIAITHLVFDGTGTVTPFFAGPFPGISAEDLRFSDNTLTCGLFCAVLQVAPGAVIADNRFESSAFDAVLVLSSEDVRFSDNTVTSCGDSCVFFLQAPGAVIVDNSFEASGAGFSVVQVQSGSHGTIISRNTVRADQARPFGIRAAGNDNVVVAHNTIYGPWRNTAIFVRGFPRGGGRFGGGISVYSNRVFGADQFGIQVHGDDNVLRSNRVTGAGLFAVRIRGCSNVLVGNNVGSADNGGGVVFDASSGANSLAGNKDVVVDDGAFDCDGDGVNDPNIITGSGAVEHGANLVELVSDAISTIPTPRGLKR